MYYNPVKIIETNNWLDECYDALRLLGINNPVIITSIGNQTRHRLSTAFNSDSIYSNVKPNPTFETCQEAIDYIKNQLFDGVIAFGGGSVMDTAKVVMASMATGIHDISELLRIDASHDKKIPSIFVPTTHGTGSEVTMWGTVWNMIEKKKYSLSDPMLYPDAAILDANLTLSLPFDISTTTILDALSHSFEAVWNKNHNRQSTKYAIEAICLILENIERLKDEPQNIELRWFFLRASYMAGLAISNTKTAAAHSISYPLTINYDIPHGIACSLPLSPLLEISKGSIENELNQIIDKLKLTGFSELKDRIKQIPDNRLKYNLKAWGVAKSDLDNLAEQSFTKGRMDNNIVDLTKKQVRQILEIIY